jgi:hypothetical protein
MLNRRKAMIGWVAYTIGKPIIMGAMKRKAKRAALAESGQGRGRTAAKWAGFLAAAGAAAGAVKFWRNRSENGTAPGSEALGTSNGSETRTPEPTAAGTEKPPS